MSSNESVGNDRFGSVYNFDKIDNPKISIANGEMYVNNVRVVPRDERARAVKKLESAERDLPRKEGRAIAIEEPPVKKGVSVRVTKAISSKTSGTPKVPKAPDENEAADPVIGEARKSGWRIVNKMESGESGPCSDSKKGDEGGCVLPAKVDDEPYVKIKNGVGIIKLVKEYFLKISPKQSDRDAVGGGKERLKDDVDALRFILDEVCVDENGVGISPEDLDGMFSTAGLRRLRIATLVDDIVALAPEHIKKECFFMAKRIVFAVAYPDYYEKNFLAHDAFGNVVRNPDGTRVSNISIGDVYDAQGDLKAALVHAASTRSSGEDDMEILNNKGTLSAIRGSNNNKRFCGGAVDSIAYDAIRNMAKASGYDYGQTLEYLSNPACTTYKTADGRIKKFGIFEVIEKRGCYKSPMDFFFLNSPQSLQIEYVDFFMNLKEKKGLESDPFMIAMYDVYRENSDAMDALMDASVSF